LLREERAAKLEDVTSDKIGVNLMISEEELDEMIDRARALGTDYAVLSDLFRLEAEVRSLRSPVEAAIRLAAERLRFKEADRLAVRQSQMVKEAEAALEAALGSASGAPPPDGEARGVTANDDLERLL